MFNFSLLLVLSLFCVNLCLSFEKYNDDISMDDYESMDYYDSDMTYSNNDLDLISDNDDSDDNDDNDEFFGSVGSHVRRAIDRIRNRLGNKPGSHFRRIFDKIKNWDDKDITDIADMENMQDITDITQDDSSNFESDTEMRHVYERVGYRGSCRNNGASLPTIRTLHFNGAPYGDCQKACDANSNCNAITYVTHWNPKRLICYLHSGTPNGAVGSANVLCDKKGKGYGRRKCMTNHEIMVDKMKCYQSWICRKYVASWRYKYDHIGAACVTNAGGNASKLAKCEEFCWCIRDGNCRANGHLDELAKTL